MAIYSYITQQCLEDSKKYNYLDEIQKISSKIENDQNIGLFNRWPKPYITKKFGSARLIATENQVEENTVICFLRLLLRSGKEYSAFIKQTNVFNDVIPNEDSLQNIIKTKSVEVNKLLPHLNDSENNFLFSDHYQHIEDEILILETEEWVKKITDRNFTDYRIKYHQILLQILEKEKGENEHFEMLNDDSRFKVFYVYLQKLGILLLLSPMKDHNELEEENIREKYFELFVDNEFSRDKILTYAVKSYPSLILYDEESWLIIQKNEEGNLALSSEEGEILNSIRITKDGEPKYPLFINGRAGSGKSTILYYLFSDILYFFRQNINSLPKTPPIFLTYSEQLLQIAKSSTKKILTANAHKLLHGEEVSDYEYDDLINDSFKTFKEYLLSLLPELEKKRFSQDRYVDFIKFKEMWNKEIPKHPDSMVRNLTPEIGWHIIRTYIKGMSNSALDYCDKEYYSKDLPIELKSVSNDTFDLVYDKIWENWFRKESEMKGYWDLQDVVKLVLNSDIEFYKHPAIFCDEAQDFTKIELEFLFKLNLYSRRQLPFNALKLVPFAFAGDPLQTLNPTGFDWTAVQANFHNQIVSALDRSKNANLKFNFKELSLNYRSSKSIVNFCNLIQLARGVALKIKRLQPQRSWSDIATPLPDFFYENDPTVEKAFKEQNDLIFVINSYEGREKDYIESEKMLRDFNEKENEHRRAVILSPTSAKGLEFNRVILYKFGQEFYLDENLNSETFERLLFGDELTDIPIEKLIPYQFFFNRLYVAASRAKKRLFIIDTENGIKHFWNYIVSNIDNLILKYSYMYNSDWELKNIAIFQNGSDLSWSQDKNDPLEIAEKLFNQGKAERNSNLLNMAAQYYHSLNNSSTATHARALALEFEDKNEQAAKKYLEISRPEEAMNCYWKSRNFKEIKNLSERYSSLKSNIKVISARFFEEAQSLENAYDFLSSFDNFIQSAKEQKALIDEINTEDTWTVIANKIFDLIKRFSLESSPNRKIWINISRLLTSLRKKGILFEENEIMAIIEFNAENYDKAIKYFKNSKLVNDKKYFISMSKVLSYPENLFWLDKIEKYEDIITYANENPSKKIEKLEDQKILIKSFDSQQIYKKVISYTSIFNNGALFNDKELLKTILASYIIENLYDEIVEKLTAHLDLEIILQIIDDSNFNDLKILKILYASCIIRLVSEGNFEKAIGILQEKDSLLYSNEEIVNTARKAFVINCAKSNFLSSLDVKKQMGVSDYLAKLYLNKPYNQNYYFNLKYIGLAIERANKINEALEYYELIINSKIPSNKVEIEFAEQRWLKTKYKQSKLPEKSNAVLEAENKFKEWGYSYLISIDNIPELPALEDISIFDDDNSRTEMSYESPLKEKEKEKMKISLLIERGTKYELKIERFDSNNKIRITNLNLDEWVSIIDFSRMVGEPEIHEVVRFSKKVVWEVSLWNVWIKIITNPNNYKYLIMSSFEEKNEILWLPLT